MFDYQKVQLVAITQPRIKHETEKVPGHWQGYDIKRYLTPDEFIAYTARVSNPANQNNTATAQRLMKYLLDNAHVSPLEMVHVVMEIKTTRDIGRQILRHRSFSFQEFSQRYAEVADLIDIREARLQDKKNRQNSIDTEDSDLSEWWQQTQSSVRKIAIEVYAEAIKRGIAKEQARVILPEGLTMSTMYMAGSVRSWLHYCQLRCGNGTQKEHMDIANKARDILCAELPSISDYLRGA